MYFILFYDFVENMLERRTPYREAHLALLQEYVDRGELLLAGALVDPADGGVSVFKLGDRADVEAFVARDPYVVNKLVTAWRIREWKVVAGAALEAEQGN